MFDKGLETIINRLSALKVTTRLLRNTQQNARIQLEITQLHELTAKKIMGLANILKGRNGRAAAENIQPILQAMLPDNLKALQKLSDKLVHIDNMTKRIQRSNALGELHSAIYYKIQDLKNNKPVVKDNTLLLLSYYNDCTEAFRQSVYNKIISVLKENNLFHPFDALSTSQFVLLEDETEAKRQQRLEASYLREQEQSIREFASRNPAFNDLYQQHKEITRLQDILYDTRYTSEDKMLPPIKLKDRIKSFEAHVN